MRHLSTVSTAEQRVAVISLDVFRIVEATGAPLTERLAAATFECSTFEGNGTTEDELRTCARTKDAQAAPAVTVDTKSVPVTEVETPLLNIVLPADNIFGLPAGTQGLSVAHGWVTLLHPLTPGTHTIFLDVAPTPITTKIVVQPDLKP